MTHNTVFSAPLTHLQYKNEQDESTLKLSKHLTDSYSRFMDTTERNLQKASGIIAISYKHIWTSLDLRETLNQTWTIQYKSRNKINMNICCRVKDEGG